MTDAVFPLEKIQFTRAEAAAYLGISTKTLDRRIRGRKIECLKDRRTIRFMRCQLDAYRARFTKSIR